MIRVLLLTHLPRCSPPQSSMASGSLSLYATNCPSHAPRATSPTKLGSNSKRLPKMTSKKSPKKAPRMNLNTKPMTMLETRSTTRLAMMPLQAKSPTTNLDHPPLTSTRAPPAPSPKRIISPTRSFSNTLLSSPSTSPRTLLGNATDAMVRVLHSRASA